jgi:hypothetical protein
MATTAEEYVDKSRRQLFKNDAASFLGRCLEQTLMENIELMFKGVEYPPTEKDSEKLVRGILKLLSDEARHRLHTTEEQIWKKYWKLTLDMNRYTPFWLFVQHIIANNTV